MTFDTAARDLFLDHLYDDFEAATALLIRQAQAFLPENLQGATRYLAHGAGQPLWPNFVERLEGAESVRSHPQQAVAGANAAFELFLAAARYTN